MGTEPLGVASKNDQWLSQCHTIFFLLYFCHNFRNSMKYSEFLKHTHIHLNLFMKQRSHKVYRHKLKFYRSTVSTGDLHVCTLWLRERVSLQTELAFWFSGLKHFSYEKSVPLDFHMVNNSSGIICPRDSPMSPVTIEQQRTKNRGMQWGMGSAHSLSGQNMKINPGNQPPYPGPLLSQFL